MRWRTSWRPSACRADAGLNLPSRADLRLLAGSTQAPRRHMTATVSESERSTAARIGQVLFKNRGWLPVPFLAVPLLVRGHQTKETWIAGLLLVLIGEAIRTAGVAAAGTVTRR